MKERWKKIRTGLIIVAFVVIGVLEYVQLMHSFDLPQVILVMPIVGAAAMIVLRKWSFIVPVSTILLSCIYQITAGGSNAVAYLQGNATNIAKILLYVLPICIVFELLGMGGGALIRILINKNKSRVFGVVMLILGLLVIVGPYEFLYKNPIYPIQARIQLKNYATEKYQDYQIAAKDVYFDLNSSDYRCRVSMSDGVIRMIYFDENGNITSEE